MISSRHRGIPLGPAHKSMPVLGMLLVCFLAGSLVGCIAGQGALSSAGITEQVTARAAADIRAFPGCLLRAGQYHLLVLAAATSTMGVFAIPLVSAFRGYFLSCAAAAVMVSLETHGIATALILCGVPALLSVPTLFLLELDGFELSMRLRAVSAGRSYLPRTEDVPQDLVLSVLSVILAALAECLLVPSLLSLVI